MVTSYPLALLGLGPQEVVLILVLAVLLFGKRLPEVGKSIGQTIVEFKKGLSAKGETTPSAETPAPAERQLPQPKRGGGTTAEEP